MPLSHKSFDEIGEEDLQRLLDNKVSESRRIDYKQSGPGQQDRQKKEFLADISSFANAGGGYLVYGMKESKGEPVELCGLELENPDQEKLRIESMIRDGIEPRIWGIGIQVVHLQDEKCAIAIHVPRSFNPPHMVTFKGEERFYSRGVAGKFRMHVPELKTAFGIGAEFADRARAFRAERLARIRAEQTPVPLYKGVKHILHVIPFDSFAAGASCNLAGFRNDPKLLPNMQRTVSNGRYNLDGFVSYGPWSTPEAPNPVYSYTQCFRNGVIETIHMPARDDKVIRCISLEWEKTTARGLREFLTVLQRIGAVSPVFVMLTFLETKGCYLVEGDTQFSDPVRGCPPFQEDCLVLPEFVLESFDADIESKLAPIFDIALNAVGKTRADIR